MTTSDHSCTRRLPGNCLSIRGDVCRNPWRPWMFTFLSDRSPDPNFFTEASPERRTRMLRITMSVSQEAAAKYFDSALEKADYYAKSEANGKGIWGGKGAERLGLSGD